MNVNAAVFSFTPAQSTPFYPQVDSCNTSMVSRGAPRACGQPSDKYQTLYKTELCKSYCENGTCRYGKHCKFAHGTQELTVETAVHKKDKNCKTFFANGACPYGVRCQFKHEHRHINQIKRYPNTVRLITYESLYANAKDQTEFIGSHETGVKKLPIFEAIHAEEAEDEETETFDFKLLNTSECCEVDGEEAGSSDSTTGSARDS